MGGCHRFVTSRYQQSQPLGIVAGSFYLYGAAFHGAGLRTVGAAAYRIVKIGQAEITLVIGPGKPFRRDAANTLAARHVNAKAAGNRLLIWDQGDHGHGSFSLWAWVKAQRCAATLPVGETGGARCKGGRDGGGSPGLHKPRTRVRGAEGWGDRPGRASAIPCAARGAAPQANHSGKSASEGRAKDPIRMRKPQNLTSDHPDRLIPDRRRGHQHAAINMTKPRSRAGLLDRSGSIGGAAGPDEVVALAVLGLDQAGIDWRGEARIVQLDREIFALRL